jgi:hypothetical protein
MNPNSVKTTPKTYQIEPKTDTLVHSTTEEVPKDPYYYANKEKCAKCKIQGNSNLFVNFLFNIF